MASSMLVREAQGAETRRRIIRSAWNVIAERGLVGTTTRLVAQDAGISHGMCHYHFQTKDELVVAVVDEARRYWIDEMERRVGSDRPADARLAEVVRWMAEPATRAVMRVHLQLVAHSEYFEPLRVRMAEEYARWHRAYVRLFEDLRAEGRLVDGLDPDVIGVGFATLADALVDQQSLDPDLDTERIMWGFLKSLLAMPGPGPASLSVPAQESNLEQAV